MCICVFVFFFFKQKTAYEIGWCDWSSDVCSSDLAIAKTTLPVEDLARAKAFYAEKLGLRPTREFAGALFYEGNGTSGFLLFPSGGHAAGQHTQMALFVKDIGASVAKLKSRGVQFEEY